MAPGGPHCLRGRAPGRPSQACALLCVAEQPDVTFDDFRDSGDFKSIGCKLAEVLHTILSSELNLEVRHLMNSERERNRMLKGRQNYLGHLAVLQGHQGG